MWETWDVMHELLNEGNLQIEKVVTHSMPYADLQSAIQLMLKGTCGKIVLTFE
jgi:threonine 3-dehydrogenase